MNQIRAPSTVGNRAHSKGHDLHGHSGSSSHTEQPESLQLVQQDALLLLAQRRKRRKRVRYSCTECHRRKHKCDRETPCGTCVERGVASSCIPHDGDAQDTFERMRQLESVLARLVDASASYSNGGHVPVASSCSVPLATESLSHTAAANSHSTPFSPNASTPSYQSTTDSRQLPVSVPRRRSNPGISTASSLPLRAQIGNETLEFSSAAQTYPPSVHFDRLVREGNLEHDEIRTLASALPPQQQTSNLLDIFFATSILSSSPLTKCGSVKPSMPMLSGMTRIISPMLETLRIISRSSHCSLRSWR